MLFKAQVSDFENLNSVWWSGNSSEVFFLYLLLWFPESVNLIFGQWTVPLKCGWNIQKP